MKMAPLLLILSEKTPLYIKYERGKVELRINTDRLLMKDTQNQDRQKDDSSLGKTDIAGKKVEIQRKLPIL